jgi:hypothetical protein
VKIYLLIPLIISCKRKHGESTKKVKK